MTRQTQTHKNKNTTLGQVGHGHSRRGLGSDTEHLLDLLITKQSCDCHVTVM